MIVKIRIRQCVRKYTLPFFFLLLTIMAVEMVIPFKLLLILGHYNFTICSQKPKHHFSTHGYQLVII